MDAFNAINAGMPPTDFMIRPVPNGCPSGPKTARMLLEQTCQNLETANNYGDFLDNALQNACSTQHIRLLDLIDGIMPRLTAKDTELADHFNTWWMLEGTPADV